MADRRLRLALAIAVVCALAAGAVALATSGGGEPHQPTRSSSPLVSLGQPIAPYRVGAPPKVGWIEMRAVHPGGRHTTAVLYHTFHKVRRGRDLRFVCADTGPERTLRRLPVQPFGACIAPADGPGAEPVTWGMGTGTHAMVTIRGQVSDEVRRLVVEGPGGTYDVPLSRHRAFLIIYSAKARGHATLTAHLRDGGTRFFAFDLPPHFRTPGSALARDPGGLPAWSVSAYVISAGARTGQTCAVYREDVDIARRGRIGGAIGPPLCGDLRSATLLADTTRASGRLFVWGAVSTAVRAIAVAGPDGRRSLPLSRTGRAFLAVYPSSVRPDDIVLEVRLADGRLLRYRAPRRLNAEVPSPPPKAGRSRRPARRPQRSREARHRGDDRRNTRA